MTPDERKAAAEYAMTWNHPRAGGARRLAHDVLVLAADAERAEAEVERLTRELDTERQARADAFGWLWAWRRRAKDVEAEVERLNRERDEARHAATSWKASYLAARDLAEALASAGGDKSESDDEDKRGVTPAEEERRFPSSTSEATSSSAAGPGEPASEKSPTSSSAGGDIAELRAEREKAWDPVFAAEADSEPSHDDIACIMALAEANERANAAEAEVERLTRERDEWEQAAGAEAQLADEMRGWALGLRAEVERLRGALVKVRDWIRFGKGNESDAAEAMDAALASAGGDTADDASWIEDDPHIVQTVRQRMQGDPSATETPCPHCGMVPSFKWPKEAGLDLNDTAEHTCRVTLAPSDHDPGCAECDRLAEAELTDPEPRCTCAPNAPNDPECPACQGAPDTPAHVIEQMERESSEMADPEPRCTCGGSDPDDHAGYCPTRGEAKQ